MVDTLTRSVDAQVDGRTLVGVAVPWDRPARVTDDGRAFYLEAFRADSADKSIAQRGVYPGFEGHDTGRRPVGSVTFHRSEQGLTFELPIARGDSGDELLELVNGGAMRSVSIGFRPINDTVRAAAGEPVTYRTEIALRHLAVVPTGYGQHPDATVEGVRAELDPPAPVLGLDVRWRAARLGIHVPR